MAAAKSVAGYGWKCSRCLYQSQIPLQSARIRAFSTALRRNDELQTVDTSTTTSPPPRHVLTPDTVVGKRQERKLFRTQHKMPIGSRRRRAVIKTMGENTIPFAQLPYQCFQEARKVLAEDREEKIKIIELFRSRIGRLEEADPTVYGGEENKQRRLDSMRQKLEQYKILADINDPLVKKKFEDGHGMNFKYRLPWARADSIRRRHEQAHLPVSGRQTMASDEAKDCDAAYHPNERCP